MLLPLHLLCLFSSIVLANAQYFSEGWKPGQPTTTQAEPSSVPFSSPASPDTPRKGPLTLLSELFDVGTILRSKPSQDLFSLVGINITEKVELIASQNNLWDERIPLITDDNYADLIVNEPLSSTEQDERVWFLVITSSAMRSDGLSKLTDETFDTAYNDTIAANDLPHVKWGRIDYLNVTALTTKWNIWHAPYLVVIKDRGQSLRFYRAQHLRLRPDLIREFLMQKGYEHTPPWTSSFGPGGEYEYIMDWFANTLARIYNVTVKLPKWLVYLVSGSIGSMIISFLHRPAAQPPVQRTRSTPPDSREKETNISSPPTSPANKGTPKQRRRGKQ